MKTIEVASGPEPWVVLVAILFAVLCLWGLLRLVVRFGSPQRKHMPCKWTRVARKDGDALKAWACKNCGELAYSATGKPPAQCKRGLSPRAL